MFRFLLGAILIFKPSKGRGVYDIRHPYEDPTPPTYFIDYVNTAYVQNAIGVNLNYSQDANDDVYYAFQQTGDFVYPNFIEDVEMLLDAGVRVSLYYGDAGMVHHLCSAELPNAD